MQPTLDELRDLSRRSRKEQRRGLVALAGSAMLFPALGLAWVLAPDRLAEAAYAAAALAGFLLVAYAHAAGQTRGAFRKVFRRIKDERASAHA